MLGRLEAHVAEQQRFAANASHELRTPLAITQTMLDVAAADPDRDPDELINRLRVVNARATQLTEALLTLSLAGRQPAGEELVDLSMIADEATEALLPLAEKRGVNLETVGHDAPTVGSPTLLRQLVINLLHNAIVHNLPDQGQVWITTGRHSGCAVLTVANTGDQVLPDLISTLTEPFQRGNDRVHHDLAGAGLGLAIVQRITQAHNGSLTIDARPQGGLTVRIQLPQASRGNDWIPHVNNMLTAGPCPGPARSHHGVTKLVQVCLVPRYDPRVRFSVFA